MVKWLAARDWLDWLVALALVCLLLLVMVMVLVLVTGDDALVWRWLDWMVWLVLADAGR